MEKAYEDTEQYKKDEKIYKKYNDRFMNKDKEACDMNIRFYNFKIQNKKGRNEIVKKEIATYNNLFNEYIERAKKYSTDKEIEELYLQIKNEIKYLTDMHIKK